MGFEPTTFCMASRRSSQLSYSRAGTDSSFAARFPADLAPVAGWSATVSGTCSLPIPAHSSARSKRRQVLAGQPLAPLRRPLIDAEREPRIPVAAIEGVVSSPHDLDVLLRHCPRSISRPAKKE